VLLHAVGNLTPLGVQPIADEAAVGKAAKSHVKLIGKRNRAPGCTKNGRIAVLQATVAKLYYPLLKNYEEFCKSGLLYTTVLMCLVQLNSDKLING
jgi:hypothetical protein